MSIFLSKCVQTYFLIYPMASDFPSFLLDLLLKVVELDFLYPSEGIHRRWESGYRITSMAATADQAAFILSIPKRKMVDETQETLRTSAFPSTHVKVHIMLISLFLPSSNT